MRLQLPTYVVLPVDCTSSTSNAEKPVSLINAWPMPYIQTCIVEYHWPPEEIVGRIQEDYIQRKYHELNLRPRKCLGYKTPYEVYFSKVLHLA